MKLNNIGDTVGDLHDGWARLHQKGFEYRSVVPFKFPGSNVPQPSKFHNVGEMFGYFLGAVRKLTPAYTYTSKLLITIDEPNDEGWWPCAWSYDGRTGGVCEVREIPS